MKKRILGVALAGALAFSAIAGSMITASAELAPPDPNRLPEYKASDGVQTYNVKFAMPGSWTGEENSDARKTWEKYGSAAGLYWWGSKDNPNDAEAAAGHGWPGWKMKKDASIPNLYSTDVPKGTASMIFSNFIDGGTEKDTTKNPFYEAANQTRDFPGQYYSRTDDHETYDILFKYIYMKSFEKAGVEGIDKLDIKSDNFWVEANKLCAKYNGEDYDKLSADEKTFQVDTVLDKYTPDLSEFGSYASNFFNEDLVGEDGIYYKAEEMQGFGQSFTFDNMVFVVNFDPNKMVASPQSGKIGYDGDFYFYYGGGEYGSWPTKELNEKMGGVSGNFTKGEYVDPNYKPPVPTVQPTPTTIPSPSGTDAKSSTNDSDNNSNTNNNGNGAIATGQFSVAVIALVVLFAGVAIVMFARKKEQD